MSSHANRWEKLIWTDDLTNSGVGITHDQSEAHNGNRYYIADYITLNLNDTLVFTSVTPGKKVAQAHMSFSASGSAGALSIDVYEGATGITGGTPFVPNNVNRNSTTASAFTDILLDPTVADDGTRIFGDYVGSRQVGGKVESEGLILKSETTYLWRITSFAQSNVISFKSDWSEVPDKRAEDI